MEGVRLDEEHDWKSCNGFKAVRWADHLPSARWVVARHTPRIPVKTGIKALLQQTMVMDQAPVFYWLRTRPFKPENAGRNRVGVRVTILM